MTVPQQTINMTTIFNCADCRKAIKENSREHDDCWTNMEKDDDLWYCGDCKDAHMDDEDDEEVVCPRCDRTEKECEEQAEDKDNKNPITDWCGEWGLSCDECYYKANPESDDDDVSINTQEECCECELTEKQYNEKKGYEENLSTLHYACGKTYCPDCREPCENSDDEEEVSECVKIREDGLGCNCAVCFGKNVGKWDGSCCWVGVGEQKPANHPYP